RYQARHPRNRAVDPGAALHQGRREGEGPHRDARVRGARVIPIHVHSPNATAKTRRRERRAFGRTSRQPCPPSRSNAERCPVTLIERLCLLSFPAWKRAPPVTPQSTPTG